MQAVKSDCLEVIPCLIAAEADVMEVDRAGYSVLSYALGNPDMVLLLLEAGADAGHIHRDGSTLMHLAVEIGNPLSVYALAMFGAPMNTRDLQAHTPIHLARGENVGLMQCLLEQGAHPDLRDQVGSTALHGAAERDDYAAAHALVKAGANLSVLSWQGWSPLHLTAIHDSVDVMCLLLESGVDVDLMTEKGQTPMMCAILKDNHDAIRALAGFGADLHRKDAFGNTPLHAALKQKKFDAAAVLVNCGAPLDIENEAGVTTQELVLRAGHHPLLESLADALTKTAETLSVNN